MASDIFDVGEALTQASLGSGSGRPIAGQLSQPVADDDRVGAVNGGNVRYHGGSRLQSSPLSTAPVTVPDTVDEIFSPLSVLPATGVLPFVNFRFSSTVAGRRGALSRKVDKARGTISGDDDADG